MHFHILINKLIRNPQKKKPVYKPKKVKSKSKKKKKTKKFSTLYQNTSQFYNINVTFAILRFTLNANVKADRPFPLRRAEGHQSSALVFLAARKEKKKEKKKKEKKEWKEKRKIPSCSRAQRETRNGAASRWDRTKSSPARKLDCEQPQRDDGHEGPSRSTPPPPLLSFSPDAGRNDSIFERERSKLSLARVSALLEWHLPRQRP